MHIIMYFQLTPTAEFSELQFSLSINSNHQMKTSHIGMRLRQAYIRENWYICNDSEITSKIVSILHDAYT